MEDYEYMKKKKEDAEKACHKQEERNHELENELQKKDSELKEERTKREEVERYVQTCEKAVKETKEQFRSDEATRQRSKTQRDETQKQNKQLEESLKCEREINMLFHEETRSAPRDVEHGQTSIDSEVGVGTQGLSSQSTSHPSSSPTPAEHNLEMRSDIQKVKKQIDESQDRAETLQGALHGAYSQIESLQAENGKLKDDLRAVILSCRTHLKQKGLNEFELFKDSLLQKVADERKINTVDLDRQKREEENALFSRSSRRRMHKKEQKKNAQAKSEEGAVDDESTTGDQEPPSPALSSLQVGPDDPKDPRLCIFLPQVSPDRNVKPLAAQPAQTPATPATMKPERSLEDKETQCEMPEESNAPGGETELMEMATQTDHPKVTEASTQTGDSGTIIREVISAPTATANAASQTTPVNREVTTREAQTELSLLTAVPPPEMPLEATGPKRDALFQILFLLGTLLCLLFSVYTVWAAMAERNMWLKANDTSFLAVDYVLLGKHNNHWVGWLSEESVSAWGPAVGVEERYGWGMEF